MEKTKQELRDRAVSMRERGDSYKSIILYLRNRTTDEDVIREIVNEINELEKSRSIKVESFSKRKVPTVNIVAGAALIVCGIVSIPFFWGKGIITTLSLTLVFAGVFAIMGRRSLLG